MQHGACSGTQLDHIFFPEDSRNSKKAKEVCGRCPVRYDCMDYALDNDIEYGVWGGLSEGERWKIQKGDRKRPRRPQGAGTGSGSGQGNGGAGRR